GSTRWCQRPRRDRCVVPDRTPAWVRVERLSRMPAAHQGAPNRSGI
ncbi:MAG: hypothetical protein AVDCRST_MAG43-911, partial [uncultured Thermomicrobiales bacterium]